MFWKASFSFSLGLCQFLVLLLLSFDHVVGRKIIIGSEIAWRHWNCCYHSLFAFKLLHIIGCKFKHDNDRNAFSFQYTNTHTHVISMQAQTVWRQNGDLCINRSIDRMTVIIAHGKHRLSVAFSKVKCISIIIWFNSLLYLPRATLI